MEIPLPLRIFSTLQHVLKHILFSYILSSCTRTHFHHIRSCTGDSCCLAVDSLVILALLFSYSDIHPTLLIFLIYSSLILRGA